ncbi:MAG: polysaccharide biosynthesis C-terminal domain-containing protein [Firmicutes bacterium]|nr:polysaccharide biosynthesis C-terminal domain-containing protein [Bacillota bacterium]
MLQSISQLLTYTMIMEFGIGGLITSSLYKPLADGDREAVSDIFNNAKKFFNKISYVYIVLVVLFAVVAKAVIKTNFDFWYVSSMVIILGANYYFNYYFALAHRLLLRADQKIRIIQGVQSLTLILNTIVCVAAIKLGAGIHTVKAISSLVFLINPVLFRLCVKHYYHISTSVYDKDRVLPRKRDGMIHHIAFFIHMNTDIVLLSIFSGTKEVSVYSVYNSVIYAIENFFTTISDSISAALGNLIAKDEKDKLRTSFELYQTVNTAAATFVCIAEAILIIPFVNIYTKGITDVNYIRPTFAYIMIAAQWFYCVRIPYNNIINAAGHYKQTKRGAYIEVMINMGISIIAVSRWGLIGVALGTMTAMAARTVYMSWYLSKNILHRKLKLFAKDTVLNICLGLTLIYILSNTITISADNLLLWAVYAAVISIIIMFAVIVFNLIINRTTIVTIIKCLNKKSIFYRIYISWKKYSVNLRHRLK